MGEVIKLDPAAVASGRSELDITAWIASAGPDWGDAEIQAYMSDHAIGSSPVDFRLPNRQIKIPLSLVARGSTTFETIRASLQQKAGLFHREQGWIMRQVGSTPLYADVMNATLHLGGSQLQAWRDVDVDAVLTLEALPDWYGDEVTLDTLSGTGYIAAPLTQGSAAAVIAGNHPGRTRIRVSNGTSNDQKGLLWGLRSLYYDAASTATLTYEAEALTPLNGAIVSTLSGASGGNVISHSSLPGGAWVPILATDLVSDGSSLTHQGSYRMWARCYSATAVPAFRLAWGVGALAVPTVNAPVQLPGPGAFYMLDLGVVTLPPIPVGTGEWTGIIQAYVTNNNDPAAVDAIYLQPLGESAGRLAYGRVPSSAVIAVGPNSPTSVTQDSFGSFSWSNLGNAQSADGQYASAQTPPATAGETNTLQAEGFGFQVPTGSTIDGIKAEVKRAAFSATNITDFTVKLIKAGAMVGSNKAKASNWPSSAAYVAYGGSTDLWGTTWTPADINASNFGTGIVASLGSSSVALVDHVRLTVYFTLAGGFTVAQDAVVYAAQTTEIRSDGALRTPDGTVYGAVANVTGDLPRIPPSGLEARPVQLFVKPSRGNFDDLADSARDSLTAQVVYRPSYLFVPD